MANVGHVGGSSSVGFGAMARQIAQGVGNLQGRVVRSWNNLGENLKNLCDRISRHVEEQRLKAPPPTLHSQESSKSYGKHLSFPTANNDFIMPAGGYAVFGGGEQGDPGAVDSSSEQQPKEKEVSP
jgi:hypothetical protein